MRPALAVPVVATWLAGLPAQAQDFIETAGPLDDDSFYRLVACAAPPGGACTKRLIRWPATRPLRVGLARIDRAYLGGKQNRARAALTRAVQYLNAAGAGIALTEVPEGAETDIAIYLVDTDGSAPIAGTGIAGLDGATVPGARVVVWSRPDTRRILRARIVFSTRLPIQHYESAMLEEITQALGLLTDIRNPHYEGVSIFSQDSNASKTLGAQDIMVLRRHYPPQE
ncbi:DUF2927 domain-containing protein [Pseudoponticoccus marisrubri]|uniref:DUF2927 domain-containing protein n=1 Tax=Pseudoponticoccus marisrubri TaxID=1685382 RepID=A0A0W7WE47_9RHOB|nr:DUF2927 domain-containing protein [Pseudoponticoccus marisrubri]KUF08793.1 hypothetical protein AVJ23_20970 [Pseudoponticoccus marisrubri]